jgi:hypothetical protein
MAGSEHEAGWTENASTVPNGFIGTPVREKFSGLPLKAWGNDEPESYSNQGHVIRTTRSP